MQDTDTVNMKHHTAKYSSTVRIVILGFSVACSSIIGNILMTHIGSTLYAEKWTKNITITFYTQDIMYDSSYPYRTHSIII